MEGLDSFHFRLHHEKGAMELVAGLVIDEMEGDVASPDKLSVTFSGSLGGLTLEASLITLGDSGYITNPLTGEWESGPTGVSSFGFFDPSKGIAGDDLTGHPPGSRPYRPRLQRPAEREIKHVTRSRVACRWRPWPRLSVGL